MVNIDIEHKKETKGYIRGLSFFWENLSPEINIKHNYIIYIYIIHITYLFHKQPAHKRCNELFFVIFLIIPYSNGPPIYEKIS